MTKLYIETKEGSFTHEGMGIPATQGNRHYRMMLDEVKTGKATIQAYDTDAGTLADKVAAERQWRDTELNKADIELNKVQDGAGSGLVSNWREYRNELRDYPDADNFPNGTRPSVKFTG